MLRESLRLGIRFLAAGSVLLECGVELLLHLGFGLLGLASLLDLGGALRCAGHARFRQPTAGERGGDDHSRGQH